MTLPDERTRAVFNVERFLHDLADPKSTPRVPATVRRRAALLLRHYPTAYDLARIAPHDLGVFCEQTARAFMEEPRK